jgi:N-acetylmuramoyl-L-alanine amidase
MLKNKPHIFLFIFLAGLMAGGCGTTSPNPPVSGTKDIYLKDICERNNIRWQWDQVSQVATLIHKETRAQVLVGSDLVMVGGERVVLGAPARMARSTVIVPPDFQSKVVDRLLREPAQPGVPSGYGRVARVRRILIDPGHGGKDPGASGRGGLQEKTVVLDIARRLRKIFQDKGYEVIMTRDADQFIALEGRTEIASRSNVDLFISVHANSSPERAVHGVEVYMAKNLEPADKNELQRQTNRRLLFGRLNLQNGDKNVERIVSDMLYAHKQAESKALASRLSRDMTRVVKTKDRGAKGSRFYVLRNTLIPAILVEVGFLTNPKEEGLLRTSAYRQRVARGLAESIVGYIDGD